MAEQTIRRNLMLREYDVKELPSGRQAVHSLKFVKKNGELVFMPMAVACGLPWSVKDNRMRGFLPVDRQGEKAGHATPVSIDAIVLWNNKKVIL